MEILKQGDSMELLKTLEEGSVDLCLTDPPYNIGDKSKMTKSKSVIQPITNLEAWGKEFTDSWKTFEEYADWLMEISKLIDRAVKPTGSIIMFLDRKFTGYFIYRMEKEIGWTFKSKFYFRKLNPVPHIRKNNYRSVIEEAVWFVKTTNRYTINFYSQEEMIPMWDMETIEVQNFMQTYWKGYIGGKRISDHPTEKYPWMIYPLLKRHAQKGQTILDPFMGSGIVGMISKNMGLNFIGFERETKYFNSAVKRIQNSNVLSDISIRDMEIEE